MCECVGVKFVCVGIENEYEVWSMSYEYVLFYVRLFRREGREEEGMMRLWLNGEWRIANGEKWKTGGEMDKLKIEDVIPGTSNCNSPHKLCRVVVYGIRR